MSLWLSRFHFARQQRWERCCRPTSRMASSGSPYSWGHRHPAHCPLDQYAAHGCELLPGHPRQLRSLHRMAGVVVTSASVRVRLGIVGSRKRRPRMLSMVQDSILPLLHQGNRLQPLIKMPGFLALVTVHRPYSPIP